MTCSDTCSTDLMEPHYMLEEGPVKVTSFTHGYGGYASHISRTAPYWCTGAPQTGSEYIELVFRKTLLITEISVSGGYVGEDMDSTVVPATTQGNANPTTASSYNVTTSQTAYINNVTQYNLTDNVTQSNVTQSNVTESTVKQDSVTNTVTENNVTENAVTQDLGNLTTTLTPPPTTTLASVIASSITFDATYTATPEYPDSSSNFYTFASNMQVINSQMTLLLCTCKDSFYLSTEQLHNPFW